MKDENFENQGVGLVLSMTIETLKKENDRFGKSIIKSRNSREAEGLHGNFYLFLIPSRKGQARLKISSIFDCENNIVTEEDDACLP